jgi:lipopolysaccharide cholinephosphotransferase
MNELNSEELKTIQLSILDKFVEYCKKNKLTYFLGYGTLLGAVRHNGFIPWDDDIDIIMPRPDYDRFIVNFKNDKLEVLHHTLNKEYPYTFAKVCDTSTILNEQMDLKFKELGINIDIFPIDGISNDLREQKKKVKLIKRYKNILNIKNISISKNRVLYKNIILFFGKVLLKSVSYQDIIQKIETEAVEKNYLTSEFIGCMVWNYDCKEVMKKEIFVNSCKLEFEGKLYNAPHNYDNYLKNLYGDYMVLPPVEERVSHHLIKAYKK